MYNLKAGRNYATIDLAEVNEGHSPSLEWVEQLVWEFNGPFTITSFWGEREH